MLLLDNFTFNEEIQLELIDYQGKSLTSVVIMEEISELIEAIMDYRANENIDTLSHLDEEICDVLLGISICRYMYNTQYSGDVKIEFEVWDDDDDIYPLLITSLCKLSKKISKMIRGKVQNSKDISKAANKVLKYIEILMNINLDITIQAYRQMYKFTIMKIINYPPKKEFISIE